MKPKKYVIVMLCLSVFLSFCSCGSKAGALLEDAKSLLSGELSTNQAKELVQGNLDVIYHNSYTDDYLEMVNSTSAEAEQQYYDGLDVEVQFFEQYFGIEYDNEEIHSRLVELYDQIYSKSQFSVGESVRDDEGNYVVTVTVQPLDIIQKSVEDLPPAVEQFNSQYTQEQIDAMDEEAYKAYDAKWADIVISVVEENLTDMDYLPEQTVEMKVAKSDDLWGITDDSMGEIDTLMIQY